MGMIASVGYVENRSTKPETPASKATESVSGDKVPLMRRLLTPVTAGVSAARHVLWYISYHAQGQRTSR